MKKKQVSKKVSSAKTAVTVQKKSVSQSRLVSDSHAELIVKIISILGYIGAAFGILFGLVLLFGGSFILSMLPLTEMPQFVGPLASALIIVLSIVLLIFSVFWIFVAKSLWHHQNWARIIVIIFAALGALQSLVTILSGSGIVSLLIDGAIIYFLGFDETVKGLFR